MAETGAGKVVSRVCEACGEAFGCGARAEGCWCVDVPLSVEAATGLKDKYLNCLCPRCLAGAAGARMPSGPDSEHESLENTPSKDGIAVRYPDGTVEMIGGAMRVDTQNFHEGMFDFYDEQGNLLRQISMNIDISWEAALREE